MLQRNGSGSFWLSGFLPLVLLFVFLRARGLYLEYKR
jgi:hypothetical protein